MSTSDDKRMLKVLDKIDRPVSFCTEGELQGTFPGLQVEGLGTIALPLSKTEAEALKKRARQAPYGKGLSTLVDTKVRRTWEIDASEITFANPAWPKAVEQAVHEVQKVLGLEEQELVSHLYKLLMYEKGGFFLPHRDSEKLDRMVASLVVVLPSDHEGGELIVRHDGQEKAFAFGGKESAFRIRYAAFYADCEHEVRPVDKGYRLALVYNLTLSKVDSIGQVKAPNLQEHVEELAEILRRWGDRISRDTDSHERSDIKAVLLDHDYTEAGLAFDTLKGLDRAKADVLLEAAKRAGCDAWLALVTHQESGEAEYAGYGRRRSRRGYYDYDDEGSDPDDYEMIEVDDCEVSAKQFSDSQGRRLPIDHISLEVEQVVSKKPMTDKKPDKQEFEGYTGNAGMTLERWYHRAAIVLWPRAVRIDVFRREGIEASVGVLESMVGEWRSAGSASRNEQWADCVEFASQIIRNWPEQDYSKGASITSERRDVSFLASLEALGEKKLVSEWIVKVLANDASVRTDATFSRVCERHGWSAFEEELLALFRKTSNETIERDATILAEFSTCNDVDKNRRALCERLSDAIFEGIKRWDTTTADRSWQSRVVERASLLNSLIRAFAATENPRLLESFIEHVVSLPKKYDVTTVQVPAILRMRQWMESLSERPESLDRWLLTVADRLMKKAASPPEVPTDWKRSSAVSCKCQDCKALSNFLEDPDTETLRLPLAKNRRQHLHQIIDKHHLDTTHVTERRGSPYILVCTKTIGSFQQAVKAHETDLEHLETIIEILQGFQSRNRRTKSEGRKRPRLKK